MLDKEIKQMKPLISESLVLMLKSDIVVTMPISSVPTFSRSYVFSKYRLSIKCHVHIWQIAPQLSCDDTC